MGLVVSEAGCPAEAGPREDGRVIIDQDQRKGWIS